MRRLPTLLFVAVLVTGCEERELREWTPDDHIHPAEADPSRMPADEQQGAGNLPPGTTEERAAAALWLMSCASCHGRDGRGDGPERPEGVDMEDMTTAEYQETRTDQDLVQVIVEGRGEMQAFGDEINERGVAALVRHIRSLGPTADPPGDGSPEAGEAAGEPAPVPAPSRPPPPAAP